MATSEKHKNINELADEAEEQEKKPKKPSTLKKISVTFKSKDGTSLQDWWKDAPKGSVMRIGDRVIVKKE